MDNFGLFWRKTGLLSQLMDLREQSQNSVREMMILTNSDKCGLFITLGVDFQYFSEWGHNGKNAGGLDQAQPAHRRWTSKHGKLNYPMQNASMTLLGYCP
jgi:hypothetical protein